MTPLHQRLRRRLRRGRPHYHRRQHSRVRHLTAAHDTYIATVTTSPEINKVRFARFIKRVLNDARDRGMNDGDIHDATGISPSTFHRWQRGDFRTPPGIDKIKAFCSGLGVPVEPALRALGAEEGRDESTPEPAIDPDVRKILRALSDPQVDDSTKTFVRETLHMLALRVSSPPKRR